ncbi:MAG: tyrosine-type recombinase/integrase, partial [Prevotellaceae bacterium]|nr:tyrosine-type recombinase/integrase [Candidatus Faecinaster equi]
RCYADMFLFSVYTCGWRLSDLITLEWRNLNLETNYIDWKIQVKTKHGLELKVPLHKNALEIIHRYKGKNKRFVFDCLAPFLSR